MNPIFKYLIDKGAQPYPGFFTLRVKPKGLYLVRYYMGPRDGELHHLMNPPLAFQNYRLLMHESGAFSYVWLES